MAKEGNTAVHPLWRDLFSLGIYKRSQGKIARQATFFVLLVLVALGSWTLLQFLAASPSKFPIVFGVFAVGVWLSYRAVNLPKFADFLIAVEAEMNKVSWPTRLELYRSTVVVIIVIFGLAGLLFLYDTIWQGLLKLLGVLPS